MRSIKSLLKAVLLCTIPAVSLTAQITIVSSVNYGNLVAPGSIASAFGSNLASQQISAVLDANGNLPKTIGSTSVQVNGEAASLFYVGPTQINFIIPDDIAVGPATVSVSNGSSTQTGIAQVQLSVPGIYTVICMRPNTSAAENAVTNTLEPFQTTTAGNPTYLSFYGTGLRWAGNPSRNSSIVNLASMVTAQFTDANGNNYAGQVVYAGKQPTLAGLDQVNVLVPAAVQGLGIVNVTLTVAGQKSNTTTVAMSTQPAPTIYTSNYTISTVAGGSTTAPAQLSSPAAVAFDSSHNLYIADAANHQIKRVDAVTGATTVYAGLGQDSVAGDGGLATAAQIGRPVAMTFDNSGSLYFVDGDNSTVRKITSAGMISSVAGSGSAGFSGDGGPATSAVLRAPSGIAINQYGTIFISDTGNNRVRRITTDGLISTIAGTGTAGIDSNTTAYNAQLNAPSDVTVDGSGNIYFADAGNFLIRRIALDGSIYTIGGAGSKGGTGVFCPATQALFGGPLRLTVDSSGRLLVADTTNQEIRMIDADCYIATIAGTASVAGFTGDNGSALQAQLSSPSGMTVDQLGDIYFADTNNGRIRKLTAATGTGVQFNSRSAQPGQTVTGYVNGPSGSTVQLTSTSGLNLPSSVTIPAGQTSATFTFIAPTVTTTTPVTVTASGSGGVTGSGSLTVNPLASGVTAGTVSVASVNVTPATIAPGAYATGRILLATPAPAGGATIQLSSNSAAAKVMPSITIPQGQSTGEFLISTTAGSTTPVAAIVTATSGSTAITSNLSIAPTGLAPTASAVVSSVTISPATLSGGQLAVGTVTLSAAAPAGGANVLLSSNNSAVTVPASILVPAGATTASFVVGANSVAGTVNAIVTASGSNSSTVGIAVNPVTGTTGSQVTLGKVSVTPGNVSAGQTATGTVTLASPAPAGGATVNLSSSVAGVTVPASFTIGAGQTVGNFTITAGSGVVPTAATISATSANTVTTPLTISAAGTGAAVSSVSVSPVSLTGGAASTGTVTLSAAAPAGGATIALSSSNNAVAVSPTVLVAAGQTSATFPIATSPVATNTTTTLTATGTGASSSTTLTVNAPCVSSASLQGTVTTVLTGAGTITGTVGLNGAAPAGGTTVNVTSGGASIGSVIVPAGQTSGAVSLNLSNVGTIKGTNASITSGSCTAFTAAVN